MVRATMTKTEEPWLRSQPELIADGLVFPEAPRWRDGRLWISDMHDGRVLATDAEGRLHPQFSVNDKPSGLGFDRSGRLLVCLMQSRRIMRWEDGRLGLFADLSALAPFPINDMVVDRRGVCYVGSLGFDPWGDVAAANLPDTASQTASIGPAPLFLVRPDGTACVATDELVFPNGMAFDPDGRHLFVAETYGHRIARLRLDRVGGIAGCATFVSFAAAPSASVAEAVACGAVMPDGIARGPDGTLWVADANGSGVLRVDQRGSVTGRVEVPGRAVYAVAVGGNDGRTLFLCAAPRLPDRASRPARSGAVFGLRIDTAGD